jgi:hypothetical protein
VTLNPGNWTIRIRDVAQNCDDVPDRPGSCAPYPCFCPAGYTVRLTFNDTPSNTRCAGLSSCPLSGSNPDFDPDLDPSCQDTSMPRPRPYAIALRTFIPCNAVESPSPLDGCDPPGPDWWDLHILEGDDRLFAVNPTCPLMPPSTCYRTQQKVTVFAYPPGKKPGSDSFLQGLSRSYAQDAIANCPLPITTRCPTPPCLDPTDDDGVVGDCVLLDCSDTGTPRCASPPCIDVQPEGSEAVRVHLQGDGEDPCIVGPTCDISWDFTITIDESVFPPRYTLKGDHDGFPDHEIYIEEQAIYQFDFCPTGEDCNSPFDLCGSMDVHVEKSGTL